MLRSQDFTPSDVGAVFKAALSFALVGLTDNHEDGGEDGRRQDNQQEDDIFPGQTLDIRNDFVDEVIHGSSHEGLRMGACRTLQRTAE